MAREVVISTWCDSCLENDEGGPLKVQGTSRSIRLDGAEGELDLCAECWDELAGELHALLVRSTQPVAKSGASKSERGSQPIECPICGEERTGRRGVQAHLKDIHGQQLAMLEAEYGHTLDGRPIIRWCPDCGAGYGDTRGAAGHRHSTGHGKVIDHPPELKGDQLTLEA